MRAVSNETITYNSYDFIIVEVVEINLFFRISIFFFPFLPLCDLLNNNFNRFRHQCEQVCEYILFVCYIPVHYIT